MNLWRLKISLLINDNGSDIKEKIEKEEWVLWEERLNLIVQLSLAAEHTLYLTPIRDGVKI